MKQAVLFSRRIALLALIAVCVSGCTATTATTSGNADPHLRPQRVSGQYSSLFALAKRVSTQAFPDGIMRAQSNEGLITIIVRDSFRGHTQIRILFEKEIDGSYLVRCSSAGYGGPLSAAQVPDPFGDITKQQVRKFMGEFEAAYSRQKASLAKSADTNATKPQPTKKPDRVPSKYDGFLNAVVVVRSTAGTGTGFFISADGYIITNKHVVGPLDNAVTIKTYDGGNLIGKVIKLAEAHDLALIKVQGEKFSWLKLADPKLYQIGSDVLAFGTPLGFDWSVSKGIISSVRNLKGIVHIQTDTAINRGNSGGPLLSAAHGEVVGVNTWGIRKDIAEGLNFSISSSEVLKAFPSMKNKKVLREN